MDYVEQNICDPKRLTLKNLANHFPYFPNYIMKLLAAGFWVVDESHSQKFIKTKIGKLMSEI